MATIPDSISPKDLEALLATAHIDSEDAENDADDTEIVHSSKGSFSAQDISALAEACDQELFSICPNPIAHKVLIIQILEKFVSWHEQTALEKGGIEGASWAADAGKLHSVLTLFKGISLGADDFTC